MTASTPLIQPPAPLLSAAYARVAELWAPSASFCAQPSLDPGGGGARGRPLRTPAAADLRGGAPASTTATCVPPPFASASSSGPAASSRFRAAPCDARLRARRLRRAALAGCCHLLGLMLPPPIDALLHHLLVSRCFSACLRKMRLSVPNALLDGSAPPLHRSVSGTHPPRPLPDWDAAQCANVDPPSPSCDFLLLTTAYLVSSNGIPPPPTHTHT